MKILLTGANGYIGKRLLPVLVKLGHEIVCCVRNKSRFATEHEDKQLQVIEIDFLDPKSPDQFPHDIDVAFYLIHSLSSAVGNFEEQEALTAKHFLALLAPTTCKQIIYLSGIVNEEILSEHLASRFNVEQILSTGRIPTTVLRAGIVVGSGSASFEIIRDLVEKLPLMVAPKWLHTRCQPIAVRNVVQFLVGVMMRQETYSTDYDIGGPEVLTYGEMLLQFAEVRKLKRYILTVPVMSPRLSSYWLYFITSTSFRLAMNLVDSMKVNIVARPNSLTQDLGIELLPYKTAVQLAYERIEQENILSSWKDSFSSSGAGREFMNSLKVPEFGCFKDVSMRTITGRADAVWQKIWTIGGNNGWYYANFLWEVRGLLDKAVGGVGLNRGRTNPTEIRLGDALDFWRVLVADKHAQRLVLFAEMKLPGEAWLEFQIVGNSDEQRLMQTATFRPRGVWGRLYWYAVLPFHHFIFNGMIDAIASSNASES